jgi:SAM-dependent methyltransferase
MTTSLEEYLGQLQLERFFRKLGAFNPEVLAGEVEHFTTKEAEKRDEIVLSYFGKEGVGRIVNVVAEHLLSPPRVQTEARVLDVGAGSGFFTVKIAEKIRKRLPKVAFYALDMTPAMLILIGKRKAEITPFLGLAENIEESIREAEDYADVPKSFDAAFSTLMLHHSVQPEMVFNSIRKVLKENGKAVILDLCEHGFEEFRTEMGDVHLGFKVEKVQEMAQKHFSRVKVERIPGICCECSGRAAEIFVASMQG